MKGKSEIAQKVELFAYQINRIYECLLLLSTKQLRLSHNLSLTCMIEPHKASYCVCPRRVRSTDETQSFVILYILSLISNEIYFSCPNDLCKATQTKLDKQQISFDEI